MQCKGGLARPAPYALTGSVMLENPAGALHLGRPTYTRGAQQINNLQKSHQTLSPRTREQRGLDLLLYVPANSEAAALSASVYVAEA